MITSWNISWSSLNHSARFVKTAYSVFRLQSSQIDVYRTYLVWVLTNLPGLMPIFWQNRIILAFHIFLRSHKSVVSSLRIVCERDWLEAYLKNEFRIPICASIIKIAVRYRDSEVNSIRDIQSWELIFALPCGNAPYNSYVPTNPTSNNSFYRQHAGHWGKQRIWSVAKWNRIWVGKFLVSPLRIVEQWPCGTRPYEIFIICKISIIRIKIKHPDISFEWGVGGQNIGAGR